MANIGFVLSTPSFPAAHADRSTPCFSTPISSHAERSLGATLIGRQQAASSSDLRSGRSAFFASERIFEDNSKQIVQRSNLSAQETVCEAVEAPNPPKKLSKNEPLKLNSNYLLGNLAQEFLAPGASISEPATQLLKFHGSYMQDQREHRAPGKEKEYQFMLRTRNPAGVVPPELYLTMDKLADEFGNGTLRATTRQCFQMHGVLKHNLKPVIQSIVQNLGSTISACGDVNRNVMSPPAPFTKPAYAIAKDWSKMVADLLRPQTPAYVELWLDGEKVDSLYEEVAEVTSERLADPGTGINTADPVEPIYGATYLPRKFKIAITADGDNSIDIYTQDIGLVVVLNDKGEHEGFNFIVGGGMGRTHNKEETFPRLGDHLGYASKEDAMRVVKAIVATQRDFGNRENRRLSRMKYLIESWGIDRFREKVEEYFGKPLQPFRPVPEWRYEDYLGWHEQGDGLLFYGLSIESGRIKNEGSFLLKDAMREIVDKYRITLRMTAHQNALLTGIKPEWKNDIASILRSHGILEFDEVDPLVRYSMACPAMPLCGLAITEAERGLPGYLKRIRRVMNKVGLSGTESLVIRMTGCPNGCARPYMAELAFVGDGPESYQIWVGGDDAQTQLAWVYKDKVKDSDMEATVEPLFAFFATDRQAGEGVGEFWARVGKTAIEEFAASYIPRKVKAFKPRVSVETKLYLQLKELAEERGQSITQVASEAVEHYLKQLQ